MENELDFFFFYKNTLVMWNDELTSPWVSTYLNAWTSRSVSETERPTGRSLMVI